MAILLAGSLLVWFLMTQDPFATGAGADESTTTTATTIATDGSTTTSTTTDASVGRSSWEEIDAAPLESVGYNFGRPQLEARSCWFPPTGYQTAGMTMPVVQYGRDEGCSVTGGDVYRRTQIRELIGHYFFADWCTGSIRSFRLENGTAGEVKEWTELGKSAGCRRSGSMPMASSSW